MGRKFGSREAYIAHRNGLAEIQRRHEIYMDRRDEAEALGHEVYMLAMKRFKQFLNGEIRLNIYTPAYNAPSGDVIPSKTVEVTLEGFPTNEG